MLLQPLVGALSDRIGRRPILIAFGVLGTALTVPILSLLGAVSTPLQAFALIMLALLIVSGYTAINAVVKAELFPVEIRALGVGLPYALTVSIFGGTAEYVALWFKSVGHETGLLLVRDRLHRDLAAGLPGHARYAQGFPDRPRSRAAGLNGPIAAAPPPVVGAWSAFRGAAGSRRRAPTCARSQPSALRAV